MDDGTSQHPAIERGPEAEDDSTSWVGLAATALFFGILAVALAIPANWDRWIVEHDSRRFGGLVDRLEAFGRLPSAGVLGLLAVLALAAGVYEIRSDRKDS